MAYGTFTLTGTLTELDGVTPHVGAVTVTPNTVIKDVTGALVMVGEKRVTLDGSGHFSITLPADDPTLNPSSGIGYTVSFGLLSAGLRPVRIPAQAIGSTLDVAEIADMGMPSPVTSIVGPQGVQGLAGPAGGGVRWVAVGDSLTSLAGGGAPYMGWATQAEILSAGKVRALTNAGVPGDNAADVLARLDAVTAQDPTLVTLWVGVNDITQGRTLAAYQSDLTAIVDALEQIRCTVVVLTIPPRDDLTKSTQINAWNGWLKALARDRSLHLIDAYDVLVDRSTGAIGADLGQGDGVHLSQLGHNRVAATFTTDILPRLVLSDPLQPLVNIDGNNLLANGLLATAPNPGADWINTGGPITGFTETWVDDADFRAGKAWEVVAVTPGSFREFLQNANGAGWSVGDTLLFTARVKVVSSSGVPAGSGLNVNCNFFGSTGINPAAQGISLAGLNGRVSAALVVPAATTTVQLDCVFNPTSAGTATWRVGDLAIYNLTTLGLT